MRFELTTVTLARWGSTTELRSLFFKTKRHYSEPRFVCKHKSGKKNLERTVGERFLIFGGLSCIQCPLCVEWAGNAYGRLENKKHGDLE